jgi:hypothetical protein
MKRALLLLVLLAACPGPRDVQLAPPKDGFQLATDAFTVPPGTEVQRCYFINMPGSGTDPIWISRMSGRRCALPVHLRPEPGRLLRPWTTASNLTQRRQGAKVGWVGVAPDARARRRSKKRPLRLCAGSED